jgi:hypothetical protein
MLEPVFDIRADFIGFHRFEMVRRDHPLAQLFKRGFGQKLAKFGLPEQDDLKQRVRAEMEVRQHPQFFERLDRKICASSTIKSERRPARASSCRNSSSMPSTAALSSAASAEGATIPKACAASRTSSLASRRLVTIWAAVNRWRSIEATRWAASVDFPAPTSPVMTMKPSPAQDHSRDRTAPCDA